MPLLHILTCIIPLIFPHSLCVHTSILLLVVKGRFIWDAPIRFGLSVEEAGLLVSKLASGELHALEFFRTTPRKHGEGESNITVPPGADLEKVRSFLCACMLFKQVTN